MNASEARKITNKQIQDSNERINQRLDQRKKDLEQELDRLEKQANYEIETHILPYILGEIQKCASQGLSYYKHYILHPHFRASYENILYPKLENRLLDLGYSVLEAHDTIFTSVDEYTETDYNFKISW